VPGAEVSVFQVPELVPEEVLKQVGAFDARKAFEHVPVMKPEQLADFDCILFGTPTRFGNMAAQMKNFLDQTGGLWFKGGLVGKVGSVFTSTASQHGGQESTLLASMIPLFHHGMVVVGTPYAEPGLTIMTEVSGGTPYGASTITGPDGSRMPSDNELKIARYQGRHAATIAMKLKS
jgi:NAD(P)H dehydrogenase (quinone)